MGAYLACEGTYRRAASQMSWLMKSEVSHSSIQRMVWQVGSRIADGEEAERRRVFEAGEAIATGKVKAEVLYGESDGVWLHLQREKRRSVEVRVATLYTGKKALGKKRYRLADKCSVVTLGLGGDAWQEQVLKTAHRHYDLEQTKLLISGGDGNQWVRRTFQRFGLQQEFVLDRFHLSRAARRCARDRATWHNSFPLAGFSLSNNSPEIDGHCWPLIQFGISAGKSVLFIVLTKLSIRRQ